jgi:hypothetical protein
MMGRRMMLGEVVCLVSFSRFPVDNELALLNAVTDPVESHIHGTRAALLNGVVGYAVGAFVISLDGGWGLRVSKFFQGDTDAAGILCDIEKSGQLGFSCGGHDMFENNARDVYGTICGCRGGGVMVGTKVEYAAGA